MDKTTKNPTLLIIISSIAILGVIGTVTGIILSECVDFELGKLIGIPSSVITVMSVLLIATCFNKISTKDVK